MIFRSRKGSGNGAAVAEGAPTASSAELSEEIDELTRANRESRDSDRERRILRLRHALGARLLDDADGSPSDPTPDTAGLPSNSELPQITPDRLTPEIVRAGMMRDGFVLIRGLVEPDAALGFADEIERSFAARAEHPDGSPETDGYYEEFHPDPPFPGLTERPWVEEAGGVLAADSPKLMFEMLDTFERVGLRRVIDGYLGEPPALSLQKCTLRKADPKVAGGWHQDGAFLGDVRALNVWVALSHCGDVAPGLDIVPRRIDHLVPTGTEGAILDWAVSPAVAEEAAGEAGIVRPIYEPGDVMLFDDLFLHQTGTDPGMPNPRFAIESWFFGPSGFPGDYVPLSF